MLARDDDERGSEVPPVEGAGDEAAGLHSGGGGDGDGRGRNGGVGLHCSGEVDG